MNIKQGSPEFDIHIEGKATILNGLEKKKNYKKLIQNEIKNEIQSTFNNGIENGIDILQLENTMYRQQNQIWKKTLKGKRIIQKDTLKHITVDITIDSTGKLDL